MQMNLSCGSTPSLSPAPGVVMDLLELAPVVDGDFIPDVPSRLFHNAVRFDYLAGFNSMDGHMFAGVDIPNINMRNETKVWVLTWQGQFLN